MEDWGKIAKVAYVMEKGNVVYIITEESPSQVEELNNKKEFWRNNKTVNRTTFGMRAIWIRKKTNKQIGTTLN